MLARTLISRALRLINVPGRGAVLSSADIQDAFDTLKELIDSDSVSKNFVPGVRRHFFDMSGGTDIYSYGSGGELDSLDFDDPAPIKIEDAYIRLGSTIQNNELLTNRNFDAGAGWTAGAGWLIQNQMASFNHASGAGTLTQTITCEIGKLYTFKVDLDITEGSLDVTIDGGAFTLNVPASDSYSFEFTATQVSHVLTFADAATSAVAQLNTTSIIEKGKDRTELVGKGSDYSLRIIDQFSYNRRFSKGAGGRPYEIYYSRTNPLPELRFDNSPTAGEILVMDVLVNRATITNLNDTILLNDEAIRYLRYRLAFDIAPEYGKMLSQAGMKTMRDAETNMLAGNLRYNHLRIDSALRRRQSFDINRGDP